MTPPTTGDYPFGVLRSLLLQWDEPAPAAAPRRLRGAVPLDQTQRARRRAANKRARQARRASRR